MIIKAVLFDLDGVLVDACEWHYEALNKALKTVMGFEISREDHIKTYNGLPTSVKLKMLNVTGNNAIFVEELKQKYTLEIILEKAKIMLEKQELHNYLKSKDIKIACVTNSIPMTAMEMLKQTGQYQYMDLIVTNKDVIKNKPDPECYNFAVNKLKIDSKECLCVEDSPKGIEAAKASCVPNLWVVSNPSDVTLKNYKEIVK